MCLFCIDKTDRTKTGCRITCKSRVFKRKIMRLAHDGLTTQKFADCNHYCGCARKQIAATVIQFIPVPTTKDNSIFFSNNGGLLSMRSCLDDLEDFMFLRRRIKAAVGLN